MHHSILNFISLFYVFIIIIFIFYISYFFYFSYLFYDVLCYILCSCSIHVIFFIFIFYACDVFLCLRDIRAMIYNVFCDVRVLYM